MAKELHNTWQCAMASLEEMADALRDARTDRSREAALQAIHEDPLELCTRRFDDEEWESGVKTGATQFQLLLSTGGPATRITGTLGRYGDVLSATLEAQDWFLPWTSFDSTAEQDAALLTYCSAFCFDC